MDLEEIINKRKFPLKKDVEFSYYWSREPGVFVNKRNGKKVEFSSAFMEKYSIPVYTGTIREWYETLVETIYDAGMQIMKKPEPGEMGLVPRDDGNQFKIFTSADIKTILEQTALYRSVYGPKSEDPYLMGILMSRFDVYVSENVDRNEIIIVNTKNDRIVRVEVLDLNII